MDEADKVAAQYAEWQTAWDHARDRAAVLLEGEPTDAELVAAVRELAEAEEQIPAPVRAMEMAMQDSTALVRALVDRGVEFANVDNAPSQIAAAVYAGWLECFRSSTTRPVEWLAPVAHMVEAVAYAIDHPDGTTERARETVAADIAAVVTNGNA